MSVKELKSYSQTSQLDINSMQAKSMNIDTDTIGTSNVNQLNANTANVDTLIVANNASLSYATAYQISLSSVSPSLIVASTPTVVTAAISTLTATQMAGGVVLGAGTAIYKSNIDTAANLFAQVPLLNGQSITLLCVNKTAFVWNFDLLDAVNVNFNNSGSSPSIPAGSQKTLLLLFTGTPSSPTYTVYL